jgi:plastocyanin
LRPVRHAAPLRLVVTAAAFALVVAACSTAAGGGAPTLTYASAPSHPASSAMNLNPSASAPTTSAVPAASGPASVAPIPTGGSAATGALLHISAQNIQFNTDHLEAPAGQAFVLEFDNNDPGVPHNVEIKDANGASMFKGQIITGPAKASYQVPALAAGNYTFVCDVHPDMTGTLTVK